MKGVRPREATRAAGGEGTARMERMESEGGGGWATEDSACVLGEPSLAPLWVHLLSVEPRVELERRDSL